MFGIFGNKPWYKQNLLLGLLKLVKFRNKLRENNLHDTSQIPNKNQLPQPVPSPDDRHLIARTADGSFNDLDNPEMGMAGTRFGRNFQLKEVYPDEKNLLNPNPRVVSRKLLTREKFIPVPPEAININLLAAAWIQFQTHGWFFHGDNQPDNKFQIPLEQGDPWAEKYGALEIKKTLVDPTRNSEDSSAPPTFINEVTHWWDGSQIYGSDQETVDRLRSHVDGQMIIDDDGLLPIVEGTGVEDTGFNENWWVGLSILHTLFVKEHNTICARLKQEYPEWKDDELFDKARLINAALMAKIHTVDWTPAILPNPITDKALNINWSGILGEDIRKFFGHFGDGEILSGIPGSSTDHHTAPYYLTEEFVSVYRMHPLIPDDFNFYSLKNGELLLEKNFHEVSGNRTRSLLQEVTMSDLFYSFGISYPGLITLHNYPRFLQELQRDNGEIFDLAAVDILRDRERGVPRYNRFRELIGRERVKSFEEINSDQKIAQELREVYNNDIDSVDLMIGLFAEELPPGFGFSETAFRIFILMASRRLKSDRFLSQDYKAEVYTQFGLDWIYRNNMSSVLRRQFPDVAPALFGRENAFYQWRPVKVSGS